MLLLALFTPAALCRPGMKEIDERCSCTRLVTSHRPSTIAITKLCFISLAACRGAMLCWCGHWAVWLGCVAYWMHPAEWLLQWQFSGNSAQKDCQEHCKTPRWQCWFISSQPLQWRWKFIDHNNAKYKSSRTSLMVSLFRNPTLTVTVTMCLTPNHAPYSSLDATVIE